jgi:NAD(P)-dependent dehydrogenase (short-subunit alcohol dehydrogenase family)
MRTVLVTGGNSGIGFECVRALARGGSRVIMASRDRAASAAAVERIRRQHPEAAVSEMGLDLGSLADVRRFAREIDDAGTTLDVLVCNAGVQLKQGMRRSTEGYELTFAVNHLGHFLLTNLLLRRLGARAPSRIVVVASGVHDSTRWTGMPKAAIADLDVLAATGGPKRDGFDGPLAYVNSKLCNIWFTYELARRLDALAAEGMPRVTANAFDPGLVPGSGLARDYPRALRFVWDRVLPGVARMLTRVLPGISPADKSGAQLARLAVDPAYDSLTARYFSSNQRWRDTPSSPDSYDRDRWRALWDASVRMTGLTSRDSPLLAAEA